MKHLAVILLLASLMQAQQRCEGTLGPCTWDIHDPPPKTSVVQPRQDPVVEQDKLINLAIHDWQLKRSLPGLPDLKRPVYVKTGVIACNESEDLVNPHKAELFWLGQCVQTGHNIVNIRVIEPVTEREYITGHIFHIVEVIWWDEGKPSSGNIYTAWVHTDDLAN